MKIVVICIISTIGLLLVACADDPIETTITTKATTSNGDLVIFDGSYEEISYPDEEVGIVQDVDTGLMRLKWPISGDNHSLNLNVETDPIDVQGYNFFAIDFESGDNLRLNNIEFVNKEGKEWGYDPGDFGSVHLPDDEFRIDMIDIPISIRSSLTKVKIELFENLTRDSEVIFQRASFTN